MAGLAFHRCSMPIRPASDEERMGNALIVLSGVVRNGVAVQAARMGQHAFDFGPLSQAAKKIIHHLLTARGNRSKHEGTKPRQPTRKEQLTVTASRRTSQADPPIRILLYAARGRGESSSDAGDVRPVLPLAPGGSEISTTRRHQKVFIISPRRACRLIYSLRGKSQSEALACRRRQALPMRGSKRKSLFQRRPGPCGDQPIR
jgi:hypothetical protein